MTGTLATVHSVAELQLKYCKKRLLQLSTLLPFISGLTSSAEQSRQTSGCFASPHDCPPSHETSRNKKLRVEQAYRRRMDGDTLCTHDVKQ